ncbi:MAG TPA: hypothetical protein VML55_05285 [Planctomycetaceae bacterium]|nr:hypothetical protein [Planctomycetaceae bacterium]
MPSPLTVRCPSCDASLKLKSRQAVGKRVPCPKCKRPFVVEEPGDEYDDFSALDEFDSYEDASDEDELEDEYEQPAARRAPSRPSSRGRSGGSRRGGRSAKSAGTGKASRRQPNKLPFIIGGAVLGVCVLVGLAFVVAGLLRKGTVEVQEFSYLPPESEAVAMVRVADLMNSPWKDQLIDPQQQQQANFIKAQSGVDMLQLESISLAAGGLDLNTLVDAAQAGMPPIGALMDPNLKLAMILRSKTAIPLEQIRQSSRVLRYKGETYYMDQQGAPVAMYLPNANTMVIGREVDIKRAIDQGPTPASLEQFAFADLKQHVGAAFAPRDRSFLQKIQIPEIPGFPAVTKLADSLKTLVGVSVSLNYEQDAAAVEVSGRCGSDADAAQMKAALDELFPQARAMMAMFAPADDSQGAQAMTLANQVLDTLAITHNGDTLVARIRVSRDAAAQFKMLSTAVTPAAPRPPVGTFPQLP